MVPVETAAPGNGPALSLPTPPETPHHISATVVLEAGPDYPDIDNYPEDLKNGYHSELASLHDAPHNWSFVGKPTDDRPNDMYAPRGKVVGGTSAINGQVFLRGLPEDYDSWAAQGNDEWEYVKLLPFLRRMEADQDIHDDFHGNDGPMRVRRHKEEAWEPLMFAFRDACITEGFPSGQDMNNPDSTGVSPLPMNNVAGVRLSTALSYINPVRHRLNLPQRPDYSDTVRWGTRHRRPGGKRWRDLRRGRRRDRPVHRLHRFTSSADGVWSRAEGASGQRGSAGGP